MCVSLVLCIFLQVIKPLFLVFSNLLSNLSKQLSKENESIRKETALVPKQKTHRNQNKILKREKLSPQEWKCDFGPRSFKDIHYVLIYFCCLCNSIESERLLVHKIKHTEECRNISSYILIWRMLHKHNSMRFFLVCKFQIKTSRKSAFCFVQVNARNHFCLYWGPTLFTMLAWQSWQDYISFTIKPDFLPVSVVLCVVVLCAAGIIYSGPFRTTQFKQLSILSGWQRGIALHPYMADNVWTTCNIRCG